MRLGEQHKSNFVAAIPGITPLKCVPICDKSLEKLQLLDKVKEGGKRITSDQLQELENIHSARQRVNTLCVLSKNGEPCGHLRGLMGLCPDVESALRFQLFLSAAEHRWLCGNCYATGNLEEEQNHGYQSMSRLGERTQTNVTPSSSSWQINSSTGTNRTAEALRGPSCLNSNCAEAVLRQWRRFAW